MLNRREAIALLASAPAALPAEGEQPWLGPEFWANPLQDWRLSQGRMECIHAGGDRNVYLLTHEAAAETGSLEMRVRLGRLDSQPLAQGWVGFRFGIRGFFNDYRDSAVFGTGVHAGIAADGRVFIGKLHDAAPKIAAPLDDIDLTLAATPSGASYDLVLTALDTRGATLAEIRHPGAPAEWLTGGLALVCHSGQIFETPDPSAAQMTMSGVNKRGQEPNGTLRFWFRDWRVSGSKIRVNKDRSLGPIVFSMYTVSKDVLKLTAQMTPVAGPEPVHLQTRRGRAWRTIASSKIDPLARTATFRVPKWDHRKDTPYRVLYRYAGADHEWTGTIRRDPVDKPKITVAGLSCNNDLGFPHADVVRNLKHFDPDFIAFTGDQIYERVGGYGITRTPVDRAALDYLRKWYIFGWEWRELTKDIPCVCLPDDHDVYHGNIWGAGGRKAEGGPGPTGQDSGGYVQAAEWVNMVQRTQTAHMPDPFDPAPVDQGIGVYYCSLSIGGVSFAVLEDRKWKSAPKTVLPKAKIVNGWAQNPAYRAPADGDAPGAQLLGERQLTFLEEWSKDWTGGVWMKSVISQTIFTNLATLPKPANTDAVTSKLPIEPVGGHGKDEVPVADHDSNGWPQAGRKAALRAMRKCFAFHIAGDQHLGSTIRYGIDEWNDAGFAICVPAVANIFPRRWYPPQPGKDPKAHDAKCTGEFTDGFGNKVTVHAVFNPQAVDHEPKALHRRAPGYGIIEFHRATREIEVTNWPRWVDATRPGAKPCEGWPIRIAQKDNGAPQAFLLPEINPGTLARIMRVSDHSSGELHYAIAVSGTRVTPGVSHGGVYRLEFLDRNGEVVEVFSGLRAHPASERPARDPGVSTDRGGDDRGQSRSE